MKGNILWFMITNIYESLICKNSLLGPGLGWGKWGPQRAKCKEVPTFRGLERPEDIFPFGSLEASLILVLDLRLILYWLFPLLTDATWWLKLI